MIQTSKLETILELSKILNSTKKPLDILKVLLNRSLDLIDGGDTGVIFIHNPQTGFLEPKVYVGFEKGIEKVRMLPGESITGHCFLTKQSLFIDSAEKLNQFSSNMSQANREIVHQFKSKQFESIHGSLVCPLIHKDETLGVIVIDNYENKASLTLEDVAILESISIQATIALVNAMHYEETMQIQEDLKTVNRLLEEQKDKYRASLELQTHFTNLALKGYSLHDILLELTNKLNRSCFLIDPLAQIMELSLFADATDLNLGSLEKLINISVLKETVVDHLLPSRSQWIKFLPIYVNQEPLGWLGLVTNSPLLGELEQVTLEHAVIAIALELLKLNEMRLQEQGYKGDFLDAMLQNQNKATLERGADHFGFNFRHPHQFVILGEDTQKIDFTDETQRKLFRATLDELTLRLEPQIKKYYPGSMCLIKDNLITVILEYKNTDLSQAVFTFFSVFLKDIETNGRLKHTTLFCAVSPMIHHLDTISEAFQNAQMAFKTAVELNHYGLPLLYDDLEVKRLLMKNPIQDLEAFLARILGPLTAYENRSKDEFLNTLRLYITTNGSWTKTKDRLHIHGNTLNYRLGRISELLDIDLDDYPQRLRLQLAFEIMDILKLNKQNLF